MHKEAYHFTPAHFEKIIDSIDEAIIGCDKDGYINFYNRANEKREKMKRHDVLHRHVNDVYDLHQHKSFLLQAMQSKKPILDRYQEYTVKDSSTTLEIFCSSVPIIENNEVIGAVSVLKDYSKVRKLSNIIMDLHAKIPSKKGNPQIASAKHCLEDIVGNDPILQDTLQFARKIANNRLPILIWGETGTGKELLAQGIHNASRYKDKPFIAINCAAIPENLLEGLLFGTAKGAFTGAMDKPGLFEQASGGTLILDEINSMDWNLQSKLLRVIQEETVRRVGDSKERKINTRLISISNTDPMDAIKQRHIRKDLYYRIAYITMTLPPLRDRLLDLPLLVEYLIKKNTERFALNTTGISGNFFELLNGYHWPGNIRELEHVIISAMSNIQGQDQDVLTIRILPDNIKRKLLASKGNKKDTTMESLTLSSMMGDFEKKAVQDALKRHKGHITNAARELGLKRQSLEYRIKKYSLEVTK